MNEHLFWLTDDQFARLEPHLPTGTRGRARVDDWRVIGGMHVLKSGCRWVDAPSIYEPRKTLYNRFVRWTDKDLAGNLSGHGFGGRASGTGVDRFVGGEGAPLRGWWNRLPAAEGKAGTSLFGDIIPSVAPISLVDGKCGAGSGAAQPPSRLPEGLLNIQELLAAQQEAA